MAIKDQCINCKSFNGNVCLLTNVAPITIKLHVSDIQREVSYWIKVIPLPL